MYKVFLSVFSKHTFETLNLNMLEESVSLFNHPSRICVKYCNLAFLRATKVS